MPTLTLKAYEYLAGLLAIALLCFGLWGWGDWHGQHVVQAKWDAANIKQIGADLNAVHASDIVTTRTVTQYITTSQIVLSQGATITKEIPVYVSAKADARCVVPVGFARVLNAAAGGQALDTNPTTGAYDSPAGIALSGAASVIADNLTTCRATANQLRSLQGWITDQLKAVNTKTAP